MNQQSILNETAKILGGTLLREGVYSGVGALSAGGKSIKFAYSLLPEASSLGEDGIVAVCFPDGYRKETGDAGDLTKYVHRIRIQLLLSMHRSDLPKALSILQPFTPVVEAAFAAKVTLSGAANNGCWIEESPGFKDDQNGGLYPGRICLEFVLMAAEEEAVSYAA